MQHNRWKEFQDCEKNSLCVHNIIFIILLPPKQRFLGITISLGFMWRGFGSRGGAAKVARVRSC